MADSRVDGWLRVLTPFQRTIRSVLEVGSYEGQSAMFWLNFFFDVAVTCIDPWVYYAHNANSAAEVEQHFDTNVGNRVRKIKRESTVALHRLGKERARFDLIYIDGDHHRDQVLIDSLLAWPLLNAGGIMIWDDYATYGLNCPAHTRPQPAIDAFVVMKGAELMVLEPGNEQFFVRKR
jgi:predicted O-methyltransferase YrrM